MKSDADKLMDRLFARKSNELVIASICHGKQTLTGRVNRLSREGGNNVVIGFQLAKGVAVEWSGRRIQSQVQESTDITTISDGGPELQLQWK